MKHTFRNEIDRCVTSFYPVDKYTVYKWMCWPFHTCLTFPVI